MRNGLTGRWSRLDECGEKRQVDEIADGGEYARVDGKKGGKKESCKKTKCSLTTDCIMSFTPIGSVC
jgi:hypothetical protein